MNLGQIAGHDNAHLVRKDLFALVIHDTAAVAIAVKPKRKICARRFHRCCHVMQHLHRFGVRVVIGEGVVEFIVARHNLDAHPLEELGRKSGSGSIARRANHLERAGHPEIAHKVIEIRLAHPFDEFVAATVAGHPFAVQYDVLELRHLLRSVGKRAVKPHLNARPAVGIVAGRYHCDGGDIQMELAEIGHGGQGRADILDVNAGLHQPHDQGVFDGKRIVAIIVAHGDDRGDAALVHLSAQTQPKGGHAGQVDLVRVFPARIVFAKAGRCNHWIFEKIPGVLGNNRSRCHRISFC